MFSPIFFMIFFHQFLSVWKVEKENKFLIGPQSFFYSQFWAFENNHLYKNIYKYWWKKLVKTGFVIWWARYFFLNLSLFLAIMHSKYNRGISTSKYLPYTRHHKPLLITSRSWIQAIHKDRIFWKNLLKNKEMVFENGAKIYKPRLIMARVRYLFTIFSVGDKNLA